MNAAGGTYYGKVPIATEVLSYPHPGLNSFYSNMTSQIFDGDLVPRIGNDLVAHIAGKNISVQSGFNMMVRLGLECQVANGADLSPFARVSPASDRKAIEQYFAISRLMKDGYPASYNNLGKLWNVIRSTALTIAPMLSLGPHPAMKAIGAITGGVASLLPAYKEKPKSKRANAEKAPAAVVETVAKDVARAVEKKLERPAPSDRKKLVIQRRKPQ